MATQAEIAICDKLTETGGNAEKVARDLGLSTSWVYEVKAKTWDPPQAIVVSESESSVLTPSDIASMMPSNIPELTKLRDKLINALEVKVEDTLCEPKDLIAALQMLLKYELALQGVARPAVNATIINDNRRVNILAEKLQGLDPGALRDLCGLPDPVVIEHNGT